MSGKRFVTCLLRPAAPISVAIAMPEVALHQHQALFCDATVVRNNPFLEEEKVTQHNHTLRHLPVRSQGDSSITARIRTADGSVVAKIRISKTVVAPGEDITGLLVMDECDGELECFQCFISLTSDQNKSAPLSNWSSVVLGLENVGFDLAVPANLPTNEEGLWSLDFQFGLVPRLKAFEEEDGEYWRAPTKLRHKIVKWSTPVHLVSNH